MSDSSHVVMCSERNDHCVQNTPSVTSRYRWCPDWVSLDGGRWRENLKGTQADTGRRWVGIELTTLFRTVLTTAGRTVLPGFLTSCFSFLTGRICKMKLKKWLSSKKNVLCINFLLDVKHCLSPICWLVKFINFPLFAFKFDIKTTNSIF